MAAEVGGRRADNFIVQAIAEDMAAGRYRPPVHTRFPPEPNAYAHLGHAGAAYLNYRLAVLNGGLFNLRFDDTNPLVEEQQYVDAIIEDLAWVGVDWGDRLFFASDYFERMYEYAEQLVRQGDAYVCDLSADEVREHRGTLTEPGKDSPYRGRSVEENLDLFRRMRAGEFPTGARTLRAKIDMAHPNLNMRDPVMYRIVHARHYRRGNAWCIYPSYDWAHGLEDSIEGVTHSCCSIEFENHRILYDWFLDRLGIFHPRQIEFARWALPYTVLSKRRILQLVKAGHVTGFDDPRLATLRGMRRRGYTPEAIRAFFDRLGVSKAPAMADPGLLEYFLRQHLNRTAPRVMGVLNPLKVVIENYPEARSEDLEAINNPEDASAGTRKVPFGRELYIEREDFMEQPPRKFYRLAPGREVRLRYAYFITCTGVIKDAGGEVLELRCTYDPATRGGDAPDGRKVQATLHWVSAAHALPATVRLYEPLFTKEDPDDVPEGGSWLDNLHPNSVTVLDRALIEPSLAGAAPGTRVQFERLGYFCVDPDSTAARLVFNRIVTLKDTWAKVRQQGWGVSTSGRGCGGGA
jgi:glutaminyl-tRNA synthetase